MALKKYYIGSTGPFYYDDANNTPDGVATQKGFRCEGDIIANQILFDEADFGMRRVTDDLEFMDTSTGQWVKLSSLSSIGGDGTAGRVIRSSCIKILDGTTASTVKASLINRFNGLSISEEDDIGKTGTWVNDKFKLNSSGDEFSIKYDALGKHSLYVLPVITRNKSNVPMVVEVEIDGSFNVLFRFYKGDGSAADLTAVVDVGEVYVDIFFITVS
jgi:hypothetical protein